MGSYYLLVLGFLLSIISGSLTAEARTSADLTDDDLAVFKKHFENILEKEIVTCENYVQVCDYVDTSSAKVCQTVMQKLTCEKITNLEGIKEVVKTIEVLDPKFVETTLGELKVINKLE